jgi:hypothetical protein
MYSLALIIFVASEKKAFEHFPIGSNVKLPPQVIVLTQDHMEKYRNMFFSEAIALIEPKLCINHWKVLYKLCVFYVDRNSKMTTYLAQINETVYMFSNSKCPGQQ